MDELTEYETGFIAGVLAARGIQPEVLTEADFRKAYELLLRLAAEAALRTLHS